MVLSQDLAGRKSTIAAVPVDFLEMERRGTTARTEVLGGVTTFTTMAYIIESLRYAYAPALVVVGLLMLASARHIAYDDMTELVPAFATIALLVFTYNIANGLTAGLALHPIVKVAAGRAREVRSGAWSSPRCPFFTMLSGSPISRRPGLQWHGSRSTRATCAVALHGSPVIH